MSKGQKHNNESFVMVESLSGGEAGNDKNSVLQLQLAMAASSINHEYARMELDETFDCSRKEELLDYMSECREKYFEARESLSHFDTEALQEFETDLMLQKFRTLHRYQA